MKKIYFNKNYLNNKFKIDYINEKNFIIFKIKNFLDKKNYDFIKKNFPKINNKNFKNFNLKNNNYKYFISSKDLDYQNMLKLNLNIKKIHKALFSKKFFFYFYKNLKKDFYNSRKNDLKFLNKLKKGIKLNKNDKGTKTHIKRQVEFSYIFNEGKIVPHTDSRFKLLSLMLYFPNYSPDNKFHKKEKNTGTIFWNSNKKNLNNNHLNDSSKEKKFVSTSNKIFKTPFEKYDLYGFIRNDKSWHSVQKIKVNKKYVRKSININFYF